MTEEDLEQVAELEKSIFSTPWSKAAFSESLQRPYSHFFVAAADEIAGYCGVHNLGGDGEITNVAVAPKYRGQKIAYEMLAFAMAETKKAGVQAFTLEVRVSNAGAIHVYEAHGFVGEGIRPGFYRMPTEDALIMWKRE